MKRGLALLALRLCAANAHAQEALTPVEVIARVDASAPAARAAQRHAQSAARLADGAAARRPTLNAALRYAEDDGPALKAEGLVLNPTGRAEAEVGLGYETAWGTQLEAGVTLDRAWRAPARGADLTSPSRTTISPNYGAAFTLNVTQPLLRGAGRVAVEAEARATRRAAALAEAEAAEALSAARLAGLEAYWALWYTQRAAALSQAHDEAAIATLREAQARAELGALADVDLIPLRLAHVEATSAVLEATADLQGARLMLAARLGLPATAAPGLRAAVAPTPITILSEAEILAALQDAYAARAPRLARQAAEDAAQITARAAQPQLDAEVGISAYGLSGAGIDDALNGLGAVEGQGAWAGLRLVLPLGDELRAAEAASARLNLEAAKAALLARRQALAAEALATRAALVAAQGRVALMETAAQLAVLAESGQRARFEAGDETATALTMASAARQAAQLRHAQAQVEVIRLDLRLRHALALPLRAWTP